MSTYMNAVDPPDLGLLPTFRRLLRLWREQWHLGVFALSCSLAYTLISTTIPILIQRAIDHAIVPHHESRLWPYLVAIVGLAALRWAINFNRRFATARIGVRIEARMRELLHCLAFALLGLRDLLGELTRAVGPRRRGSRSRGAPATLPAGDLEPKLLELLLARSDILCVLAQPPLHVLDLRERLLVAAPHVQRVVHQDEVSLSNRLVATINGHTS